MPRPRLGASACGGCCGMHPPAFCGINLFRGEHCMWPAAAGAVISLLYEGESWQLRTLQPALLDREACVFACALPGVLSGVRCVAVLHTVCACAGLRALGMACQHLFVALPEGCGAGGIFSGEASTQCHDSWGARTHKHLE